MNELQIASIIIMKRREKGITQKEIAEYMGVSRAAVSKWEKGQSYPDITLLPRLAAYFNVSIDELLGYSPQLTHDEIRKLCRNQSAAFTDKPLEEAMPKFKEVIKKYYSCFPLVYHMSVLLVEHFAMLTEETHFEAIKEAKDLFKRIVSDCTDVMLARDALNMQALCSILLKQPDDVFLLLGEFINIQSLNEGSLIAIAFILTGNNDKAKEVYQCGIYNNLYHLVESLVEYVYLLDDNFDMAQMAFNKTMDLIQLFNISNLNSDTMTKAYLLGAHLYCKHGDLDKSLEFLEKYLDFCTTKYFTPSIKGDEFFTDIDEWLSHDERDESVLSESAVKAILLHDLQAFPSFTILSDNPRYKRIMKKFNEFVETSREQQEGSI